MRSRWPAGSIAGRPRSSRGWPGIENQKRTVERYERKVRMELTLDDEGTHTLFGNHDENLRMLEDEFAVKISSRGGEIFVSGAPDNVAPVEKLLTQMQELIEQGYPLKRSDI